METPFVAFDVETTGLHALTDRVVEVGAVSFGFDGPAERFESLVNPGRPIPADAVAVHGIDDSMVAGAPDFASIAGDLFRLFEGRVLVAHNAPFDASFLLSECERAGLAPPEIAALDSCRLARAAFPGLQKYSLDFLVCEFALDRSAGHRALPDATAAADLLIRSLRPFGVTGAGDLPPFYKERGGPIPIEALGYDPSPALPPGFEAITAARETGKKLAIRYRDRFGGETKREVVPLRVASIRGSFLMEAYCHLRKRTLCFRLDRIRGIEDRPD